MDKKHIFALFISASIGIVVVLGIFSKDTIENEGLISPYSKRPFTSRKTLKKLKPTFLHKDSFPELVCNNLVMIGKVGKYGVDGIPGKLLRVLRFQNVSNAVERRYNLPRHIILAMVMEESSGVDLLPNALGDGGFGLCHMQASVARDFGLRTYKNCKALICNGRSRRSCRNAHDQYLNHARDLKELILQHGSNRRVLIRYDDRLNPVVNLDAVGRMLAYHMAGRRYKNLDPFHTAISRYAGSYNYDAYWRDVQHNMKVLGKDGVVAWLEKKFNALNPSLTINGASAGFKEYIALSQEQNYNYGLAEYEKLPPYHSSKNPKQ